MECIWDKEISAFPNSIERTHTRSSVGLSRKEEDCVAALRGVWFCPKTVRPSRRERNTFSTSSKSKTVNRLHLTFYTCCCDTQHVPNLSWPCTLLLTSNRLNCGILNNRWEEMCPLGHENIFTSSIPLLMLLSNLPFPFSLYHWVILGTSLEIQWLGLDAHFCGLGSIPSGN